MIFGLNSIISLLFEVNLLDVAICDTCLKRGMLCPSCEKRLKDGEISQLDVDVANILYSLSSTNRGLNYLVLKRSIDAGDVIILVTSPGDVGVLIGRGGKIVKHLSEKLGKRVRVVGESHDHLAVARDLLSPVPILGINIIYPPGEGEKYKVRISNKEATRLSGDIETLQKLLSDLTGKAMVLSLE